MVPPPLPHPSRRRDSTREKSPKKVWTPFDNIKPWTAGTEAEPTALPTPTEPGRGYHGAAVRGMTPLQKLEVEREGGRGVGLLGSRGNGVGEVLYTRWPVLFRTTVTLTS